MCSLSRFGNSFRQRPIGGILALGRFTAPWSADTFADTPVPIRPLPALRPEETLPERGFLGCRGRDLNPRHADYDSAALTTELPRRGDKS
jgi:hypothetical protein